MTSPTEPWRYDATNTIAPTNPTPKISHESDCHNAVVHRAAATGRYQSSAAALRCAVSLGPVPLTRTSFAGGAVVPSTKRLRGSLILDATLSSTSRSTAGRWVELNTVGIANRTSRINTGLIEARRMTVNTRRRTQPSVENSDMNRWSR